MCYIEAVRVPKLPVHSFPNHGSNVKSEGASSPSMYRVDFCLKYPSAGCLSKELVEPCGLFHLSSRPVTIDFQTIGAVPAASADRDERELSRLSVPSSISLVK